MPYQPSFALVSPSAESVPGAPDLVAADSSVRYWHVDSWDVGEGEDLWKPGKRAYSRSWGVRPKRTGDGLVTGAYTAATVKVDDSSMADSYSLGSGIGQLWCGRDTTIHAFVPASGKWSTAGWTVGSAGATITSIADGDDGLNMFVGHTDDKIYKVPAAGGASHNNQFTNPVVCSFQGVLYALDGNWLYSVDKTAANTRTSLSEPAGSSATYLASTNPYRRLAVSDKGPIWYQRLDNGQTIIWEYNQATDTDSRVGMLPVEDAWPYSILWAHGYIFVGFRYAAGDAAVGEAYLYYGRGGQKGVAGPFYTNISTASSPVIVAGTIGDDLIVKFGAGVWGYSLSSGGIYRIGVDSYVPTAAATFGKDVFVAGAYAGFDRVTRTQTDLYSTDAAASIYLYSGRYDFGLPGLDKVLLDVTMTTDPLPALTAITVGVRVENGTETALTGTWDTDGETSHTWTASTSTTSLVGRDFELVIHPVTTSSAATATILSVTARALPIERQRLFRLELDTGTWPGQSAGYSPRSSDILADLRAIGESNVLASFSNPWEGEEQDAPLTYTVLPSQLTYVEAEGPGMIGVLELRETAYV